MVVKKEAPVGVKIISVFYYMGACLLGLFGLLFFIGAGGLASLIESTGALAGLGSGVFFFLGFLLLGLGAFNFFIGRGLWKLKNWSRILVIIFSALGLISTIAGLIISGPSVILGLIINGAIFGYLAFSKEVKEAFN